MRRAWRRRCAPTRPRSRFRIASGTTWRRAPPARRRRRWPPRRASGAWGGRAGAWWAATRGGAGAQAIGRPRAAGGGTADRRSPDQLRKEVLERMRALRAWRIVDELKLDEATSARLFPILAKYDDQELAL